MKSGSEVQAANAATAAEDAESPKKLLRSTLTPNVACRPRVDRSIASLCPHCFTIWLALFLPINLRSTGLIGERRMSPRPPDHEHQWR